MPMQKRQSLVKRFLL
ncbi:MAG: hypothetical protein R6X15_03975 [Pseudomonadota bacterium]